MSRYIKLEDLQKFPIRINHYDKKNGNEHFVYGVESVLEYAEYLPTADVVEVRHGRWKKVSDKYPRYVCTCCNHLFNNKAYKFCPKCGAKMDGERSENGK